MFTEGKSGNPTGRKKGTGNKSTEKVKNAFASLLEDNLPQLKKDVNKMTPNGRAYFLLNLAEYILPKLSRAHVEANTNTINTIKIEFVGENKPSISATIN